MASLLVLLFISSISSAHTAAWAPGMYCLGTAQNWNMPVHPLYKLSKHDWWFQHDRGCDTQAPSPGEFLELPAGGAFTVELAHNKLQTTLGRCPPGLKCMSEWPDGREHPEDWTNGFAGRPSTFDCLSDFQLHTRNESMAAGTAWAISYQTDLSAVTMENLVVFTTLAHTPWKRLATYEVPADLPSCPPEGCTCAWLWIPNGCGDPNIYMQGFRCRVTNVTSERRLERAKPPIPCKGEPGNCVKGAKQIIVWHQLEGNNVEDEYEFPGYNIDMGWSNGAQNDIFQ
ncbi:hypothetical protein OIDMADRAFT_100008 [Oidiodendron maius Zn]|uniref:Uncharacterized protein n=1 Tax=Oidiodendron maius (strain Zn) TaxID=913774 RepID=A0A0C3HZ49_OIDMZ|nr:hypothetical protein OIDMADRAFT_100008 [Oidiodendron maius Zn]